jgi:ankyrin repeat protein
MSKRFFFALFLCLAGAAASASDEDFILAAGQGDLKMVKLLLKYKADPNVTNEGYSALLYAAQEGHLEVVKALVEAGADVNREVDGFTALMMAEGAPHLEIAKYLRSKGAK